jgi:hypothetical protein
VRQKGSGRKREIGERRGRKREMGEKGKGERGGRGKW